MVDGGVVDQDVDAAQLGDNPLRHGVDRLPVGDIDLDGEGATACRDDLRHHLVELVLRPASDGHSGAGRGQGRTDPRAEAATATGDDGDPSI